MSLKRVLGRTPSVTDLSVDRSIEDPFPHLYTEYSAPSEASRLADLNKILDEPTLSLEIIPNMNHSALFESNKEIVYIGWPGGDVSTGSKLTYPIFTDQLKTQLAALYSKVNSHPVFLKPKEAKNHFEGFCKNRLWSVLHYSMWRNLMDLAWEQEIYDDYAKVNREYAAKVMELWRPGDFGNVMFLIS